MALMEKGIKEAALAIHCCNSGASGNSGISTSAAASAGVSATSATASADHQPIEFGRFVNSSCLHERRSCPRCEFAWRPEPLSESERHPTRSIPPGCRQGWRARRNTPSGPRSRRTQRHPAGKISELQAILDSTSVESAASPEAQISEVLANLQSMKPPLRLHCTSCKKDWKAASGAFSRMNQKYSSCEQASRGRMSCSQCGSVALPNVRQPMRHQTLNCEQTWGRKPLTSHC